MNEPWLHPGMIGGILGSTIGILGAITGTLGGVLAPKGKAKKLVLGVELSAIALSLILLVIGIVAYLADQPRDLWYTFGYVGLLGTVLFGTGFVVILKRYRHAELRKSMSEDLTLGNNDNVRHD